MKCYVCKDFLSNNELEMYTLVELELCYECYIELKDEEEEEE